MVHRETIEWLHFLVRFDPQARLLVIGAARADELDTSTHSCICSGTCGVPRSSSRSLSSRWMRRTAALATEVGNHAIDDLAATCLYRETEGNPLFIVETVRARRRWSLRHLEAGGP